MLGENKIVLYLYPVCRNIYGLASFWLELCDLITNEF